MKTLLSYFVVSAGSLLICVLPLRAQSDTTDKTPVVGVTTAQVESLAFLPSRNAPARVVALNQSLIPAQINAVLEQFERKVGDQFNAGDLLAQLECDDRELELANQTAQVARLSESLAFAKRQYVRGQQLAKRKTIGEAELDQLNTEASAAENLLSAQKAMLKGAKLGVERCQIRAPFAGVVVNRLASVGEMLSVGSPIIEIVDLDQTEVSALVSITDAEAYLTANQFQLEVGEQAFELVNRSLLPVVNETSRTREARLDFKNESALPGSAGRLIWFSPFYHLPANLLLQRGDKAGVFIVEQNKAKFIEVKEAQEGRPVLLKNYQQWQGKSLIIDGRHGLVDGQTIRVKASEKNSTTTTHSATKGI